MTTTEITYPTPSPLPPRDPLGEVLHLLRLTGTLHCHAELTAPWGLAIPPIDECMVLEIVNAGRCWLDVEGEDSRALREGNLVLLPHGTAHTIRSDVDVEPQPLFDLPVEKISDRYEILRYGGGDAFTQITAGVVRVDRSVVGNLLTLFPKVLQIDAWDDKSGWLQSTLRFLAQEARDLKPGGETIITRLTDILIIQLIRTWIETESGTNQGWLKALRDEQIGQALVLIQREPQHRWTVASLAKVVNMSRSAFSARFTALVGQPVMDYLTHWRMQLAYTLLQETKESLAAIAHRVGYESEVTFSRAFKRLYGISPGKVRRAEREIDFKH
ncbi:MAG: AraC family transcriptional regulator [Cyanobacteria bacterium P01_H01_bin.121]